MVIAIRADRVLRSSSAELISDGAVVVDKGRIVQVGTWESLRPGLSGAQVRDLGDATLMPGLFDCHVHLQLDPTNPHGGTAIALTDEELRPVVRRHALRLLDAGVTTARDLGSRGPTCTELRDAIAAGSAAGPRLLCANAPLTVPGGHCHAMGGECAGEAGVRAEVGRRHAEGADLVKVMSTGGFMTAGTGPGRATFSPAEMAALADEAHARGLPVTTHATGTEGIARAVDAGFDSIEHCAWIAPDGRRAVIDEEVARRMVEKGVAVCPTMNTACIEHDYFCPWDVREVVLANLSRMREIGVKLLVGTDAGIGLCPFERYADGIIALGDAGYTAREIIQGATENAAAACGLSDETGWLEAGLAADLAAFAGNPLESLEAFGKPCFVMARGREHVLTPIAPIPEHVSEIKHEIFRTLRKGAGVDTAEA